MDNSENKKELLEKIRGIEEQISLLNELKEKLIDKVDSLPKGTEKYICDVHPKKFKGPISAKPEKDGHAILSISKKIEIFSNMFSGRNDVYARMWTSRKTGKSGYSPACKNEWVRGICQKPEIKCSQCPNREFIPLDESVVEKHLKGVQVIGVYPMLQDETCHFLAVDFDENDWFDDVNAFRETCESEDVPVAIERSRSGNGAHAWIFFDKTMPAYMARKMGSFLITRTMEGRYQLDMKSYDRLFPSQDTMPKGGFGNLIALPFQKGAVKQGNSVFIDSRGVPYQDQWKYLLEQKKMTFIDVEKVVEEASKNGQILGFRRSSVKEEDPPWMKLPSGKSKYKTKILDLPERIEAVIADRIYIKTEGTPPVLLSQIKQLAAFQNPEFYKRQNMRLSTFATPRIICCAEILDGYLSIPRGCLEDIVCLMDEYGIKIDVRNEKVTGKKGKWNFCGKLSKEQARISKKILKHETGGISVASRGRENGSGYPCNCQEKEEYVNISAS